MTTTQTVWWVYVTFGPCELPDECRTPTQDHAAIVAAYEEAMAELSTMGRQSWTASSSWLHGYATEAQAAGGDCSTDLGKRGRVA